MKKLLVVVDYQKDFVSGSLGFAEAQQLESAICCKIQEYRESGDEIAFTFDTHGKNYLSTAEGRSLPVSHCIEGTDGWQLYGKVAALQHPDDYVFKKGTFGSLQLADFLKNSNYDSIELVGVVSNICVLSNAVLAKAAKPESEIIVDAGCTASNDPAMNQKALDVLEGLFIRVLR